LTGFFLVPWVGSYRIVAAAAVVNLLLALALDWFYSLNRLVPVLANLALLVGILLVGWSSIFYNRALASFSTALYWNLHQAPLTLREAANTEDIVFLEGRLKRDNLSFEER